MFVFFLRKLWNTLRVAVFATVTGVGSDTFPISCRFCCYFACIVMPKGRGCSSRLCLDTTIGTISISVVAACGTGCRYCSSDFCMDMVICIKLTIFLTTYGADCFFGTGSCSALMVCKRNGSSCYQQFPAIRTVGISGIACFAAGCFLSISDLCMRMFTG